MQMQIHKKPILLFTVLVLIAVAIVTFDLAMTLSFVLASPTTTSSNITTYTIDEAITVTEKGADYASRINDFMRSCIDRSEQGDLSSIQPCAAVLDAYNQAVGDVFREHSKEFDDIMYGIRD